VGDDGSPRGLSVGSPTSTNTPNTNVFAVGTRGHLGVTATLNVASFTIVGAMARHDPAGGVMTERLTHPSSTRAAAARGSAVGAKESIEELLAGGRCPPHSAAGHADGGLHRAGRHRLPGRLRDRSSIVRPTGRERPGWHPARAAVIFVTGSRRVLLGEYALDMDLLTGAPGSATRFDADLVDLRELHVHLLRAQGSIMARPSAGLGSRCRSAT